MSEPTKKQQLFASSGIPQAPDTPQRGPKEPPAMPPPGKTAVGVTPAMVKYLIIGVIAAIVIAAFYVFVASPWLEKQNVENIIAEAEQNQGAIELSNSTNVSVDAAGAPGAQESQFALMGGEGTYPQFVFSNGVANTDKKLVDVYIDFGAQKSRDFLLTNREMLQSLVESGKIDLVLHVVPSDLPLSVYIPSAIAQGGSEKPAQAWGFLMELLRQSPSLEVKPNEEILSGMEAIAQDHGVGVTAQTLASGLYSGWILTGSEDDKLKVGYYPPIIYIDSVEYDQTDKGINGNQELIKELIK